MAYDAALLAAYPVKVAPDRPLAEPGQRIDEAELITTKAPPPFFSKMGVNACAIRTKPTTLTSI